MEEEIKEKIVISLSDEIERECQVVYILVEIRKFLEKKNRKDNYPLLIFYCDWILHPRKDHIDDVTQKIIDEIGENILNGWYNPSISLNFIRFESFFNDLDSFLKDFQILNSLSVEKKVAFRVLLKKIIEECPLDSKKGSVKQIKFTRTVNDNDSNIIIKLVNNQTFGVKLAEN